MQENAELKNFLQQFHDQLTNERNMVCRLTYDKMAAQQQFFVCIQGFLTRWPLLPVWSLLCRCSLSERRTELVNLIISGD